jgi:hypothetical protein
MCPLLLHLRFANVFLTCVLFYCICGLLINSSFQHTIAFTVTWAPFFNTSLYEDHRYVLGPPVLVILHLHPRSVCHNQEYPQTRLPVTSRFPLRPPPGMLLLLSTLLLGQGFTPPPTPGGGMLTGNKCVALFLVIMPPIPKTQQKINFSTIFTVSFTHMLTFMTLSKITHIGNLNTQKAQFRGGNAGRSQYTQGPNRKDDPQ